MRAFQRSLLSRKPHQRDRWTLVAPPFVVILVALVSLATGCGPKRLVLDVQRNALENPERGTPVTIVRVSDRRVFKELPKREGRASADPKTWASRENHPFVPQLETGGIDDPSITVRAVAQKRNPSSGEVSCDLLLPEGDSVETLAREAIAEAFRRSGYRVLEYGEAGDGDSHTVEADIEEFWAWNGLGEARFKHYTNRGANVHVLHFKVTLEIFSELPPFEEGHRVRGEVTLHSMLWVTRRSFRNAVTRGLDDLVENLESELEAARAHRPAVLARPPALAADAPIKSAE
jgi:hypothetical protein